MDTDASQPASAARYSAARLPSERAIFNAIVLGGLLLRLYMIITTTYVWDEDREWIRLGLAIDFWGDDQNLPWRSVSHPALSGYLVSLTSALFGENAMGFRIGFAFAGAATIWAVGTLAWEWLGFPGAVVAALAVAFNEYHVGISSFAMEKSPYLLFSALTILQFGRYLQRQNARHLYLAAIFAGLSYLFKELAGLLLPVLFLTLVASGRLSLLRRKEFFIAVGLGALVILPDIVWNVVNWESGFGLHTSRIEGFGVNRHFLLFFGRDAIRDLYAALGRNLFDPVDEYPAMSALWGALLLAAGAFAIIRWKQLASVGRLAAILFWFILLFFVLTRSSTSRWVPETQTMIDPKAWFWVDQVLIAGALLVGWFVTRLPRPWSRVAFGLVVVACGYATARVLIGKLGVPNASIVFAPRTIWPPTNDLVPVRAHLHACQVCDPQSRLVEVEVDRNDGKGPGPPTPGEVTDIALSTDDREFRVLAVPGQNPERRDYIFRYAVDDWTAPQRTLAAPVTIMSRRLPLPFWLPPTR